MIIVEKNHNNGVSSEQVVFSLSAFVNDYSQNYHMNQKKWNDIGYNFLVGEDGNVYEGRGWGQHGAHSVSYNSKSIGICLIGNFVRKFFDILIHL